MNSPYRTPEAPTLSHDELLRRQTNEKLSEELVAMAKTVRELFASGNSIEGMGAQHAYERMAAVLKARGV